MLCAILESLATTNCDALAYGQNNRGYPCLRYLSKNHDLYLVCPFENFSLMLRSDVTNCRRSATILDQHIALLTKLYRVVIVPTPIVTEYLGFFKVPPLSLPNIERLAIAESVT